MNGYMFSDNTLFVLIVLSWVFLIAGIIIACFQFIKRKEKSLSSKIMMFSVMLFVSLFLLRFSTGTFVNQLIINNAADDELMNVLEGTVSMHWLETAARSLVQTLRTFALDEDYAIFHIVSERMSNSVLSAHWMLPLVYKAHAAMVTVLAPVAGGAIIFDILTRIFPKLKLWIMPFWCEFYVFSELNDTSLALAQSIKENFKSNSKINEKGSAIIKPKRPVIVFTDAYIDKEDEAVSERTASAKSIGAICLTEDIFHIRIRGYFRRILGSRLNYFLLDEKEENNLHALAMLSEYKNGTRLLDSSVYLFSNSSSAGEVVRCVNKKLEGIYGTDNKKLPVIRVIEGYRNLVYNLLRDVPLYEPLIGRNANTKEKELNVTIIGSGVIGMQMFLATYWMGQMLDVNLCINVISQEKEASFKDRLNLINEDILKTESSVADPEILRIYPASQELAAPYFTLRYEEADVMKGTLFEALSKKQNDSGFSICQSDYFVVALGSDESNILVANKLRQYIGRALLCDKTNRRAIINYVVYDRDICRTLNSVQDNPNIYMNAFGNLSDVYNYENVFMAKSYGAAVEVNATYISKAFADKKYGRKEMNRFLADEYNYWSSIARGIHIPYKFFSAGAVTSSHIFDGATIATEDPQVLSRYLKKVCIELPFAEDNLPAVEQREELYYKLTWLEHRRWTAFVRTGGFMTPCKEQLDSYAYRSGNKTKEVSLRLHPCLVECDDLPPRIPAVKERTADISPEAVLDTKEIILNGYDKLDAVSLYLHILAKERTGGCCCIYKAYDCPYEIGADGVTVKVQ